MDLPSSATKEDEEQGHKEEGHSNESHIDQGRAQVLYELHGAKTEEVKVLIQGTVIVIIREIAFLQCQPRLKPILCLKNV